MVALCGPGDMPTQIGKVRPFYALAGAIQAFEFTYELSLKLLKRFIENNQLITEVSDYLSFNTFIRIGYEAGLLNAELKDWKLFREQRGWDKNGNLFASIHRNKCRTHCDFGFAKTNIAADQSVHRRAEREIVDHSFNGAGLIFGRVILEAG